jgi:peptide/nickel transport system substrate-binding protein
MIDANWDFENHPLGSGAYKFVEHKTDTHVILERNEDFFVRPNLDKIVYKIITDKSVSAIALQNKDVDISLAILATEVANIAKYDYLRLASGGTGSYRWVGYRCDWSFFQDKELRKALRRAIDWDGAIAALFANDAGVELARRAYSCIPYERPGGDIDDSAKAQWESYDPAAAQARLDELGWKKGADGIREKDGQKLVIRWLTYPSRQELPLLAESAQATLKDIGMDVQINNTKDHNTIRKDPTAWDIWVSANVNAGLGDPANFFATCCLDNSIKNAGGHHSDRLEELAAQLDTTFDVNERARLAIEMQQELLDDNSYVFCSFLRMSMISQANVTGLEAHTCDFYELTADLDIN